MSGSAGWVKLHRAINDNWIWSCERHSKQSAWLDLIMMVNHEDRKITIGTQVVVIQRGSVWTSYKKLKARWRWSNDRLYGFIRALVSDGMIAVQTTNTGTLLTVLNYSIYQGSGGSDDEEPEREPERESERTPDTEPETKPETNKNDRRMNKNGKKGGGGDPVKYEP